MCCAAGSVAEVLESHETVGEARGRGGSSRQPKVRPPPPLETLPPGRFQPRDDAAGTTCPSPLPLFLRLALNLQAPLLSLPAAALLAHIRRPAAARGGPSARCCGSAPVAERQPPQRLLVEPEDVVLHIKPFVHRLPAQRHGHVSWGQPCSCAAASATISHSSAPGGAGAMSRLQFLRARY